MNSFSTAALLLVSGAGTGVCELTNQKRLGVREGGP